jgi:WD40 repeat protein
LTLIGQSLMWQKEKGWISQGTSSYDLLRGEIRRTLPAQRVDTIPATLVKTIKYTKETMVECVQFSPDGQSIGVGTADGFLELWDLDGQLKDDAGSDQESTMSMESTVTCLAWSGQGTMIVAGSALGVVSVWNSSTRRCVRSFKTLFSSDTKSASLTCVSFSRDDSQILSSSLDGSVR